MVVLEFVVNDGMVDGTHDSFDTPRRRAYEQLLRTVLSLDNAPAVISMHFFAWWRAKKYPMNPLDPSLFYNTAENDLSVMAQYYDVPSLSIR